MQCLSSVQPPSGVLEDPVGRSEQLHRRPAGGFRDHEREDQIERGGKRLGGERQRVERLVWQPRIGEDLAGQIEIRKRTLEHDGRPVERCAGAALHRARDLDQLLFTIAAHRPSHRLVAACGVGGREHRR